jgi:hypothetical protein
MGAWLEMMTNKVNFHGSNEEKGWWGKKQLWGFKIVAFCACVVYAKLKGSITL